MNRIRPSIGLGKMMPARWSIRLRSTTTWIPLVGRSIGAAPASSSSRIRSAQGPAAFTTTLARITERRPVSRSSTRAPTTRPAVRSSDRTAV
jgi:hypothetical protein